MTSNQSNIRDTQATPPQKSIWYFEICVSKNRATPKWMVYNGKPYLNGWFGGTTIFGNIQMHFSTTAFVDSTFVGPKMVVFFFKGDFGRKPLRGEIPNPRWEKRRDLSFYPRWLLQEVANKLWRGHESKPSLRARSEVAKKKPWRLDWLVLFFSHGEMKYRNLEPEIHSVFNRFRSDTRNPQQNPSHRHPQPLPGFLSFQDSRGYAARSDWANGPNSVFMYVMRSFKAPGNLKPWQLVTREGSLPAGRFQKDSPFKTFIFGGQRTFQFCTDFFSAKHVTYLGSCIQGKSGRFQGGLVGGITLVEVKNSSRNTDGNQV